jgi:mRNA export factor
LLLAAKPHTKPIVGAPTATVIGKHDQPVKSIHYVQQHNMVVTGSWDSTVRFWDMRQPTETFKLQLQHKVYAMDVNFPFMVVSTAEATQAGNPRVHLYSIAQGAPQLFNNTPIDSTLKHQTRCVSIFNGPRQGFVIGSIEGRVEIKDIGDLNGKQSFAFKCHRQKNPQNQHGKEYNHVYSVNSVAFNSRGSFATAGSDGIYNFWDKEVRSRLKEFKPGAGCRANQPARNPGAPGQTISACAWSSTSEMFAYASSYDWSRGDDPSLRSLPNDIYLHLVTENDLKPPKPTTGRK